MTADKPNIDVYSQIKNAVESCISEVKFREEEDCEVSVGPYGKRTRILTMVLAEVPAKSLSLELGERIVGVVGGQMDYELLASRVIIKGALNGEAFHLQVAGK